MNPTDQVNPHTAGTGPVPDLDRVARAGFPGLIGQGEQLHEGVVGWLGEGRQVWVYFNNDGGGYAIENARMLRGMVG